MSLSQHPYPPWRGLAASLLLHAGLLGGVGSWSASSGDEAPTVATIELVSLPAEPVAAPSPARAAAPAATPAVAPPASSKPARPVRRARPAAEPVAAAVPSGLSEAGGPESVAAEPAGGAGDALADSSGVASSASSTASDAAPMAGNPPPLYPLSARRAGREGRTVLLVALSATGDCVEVRVAESSGTASLDESAIAAVKTWRFHPAIRGNQPVAVTLRVPIQFSLNSGLSGLPVVGQR